MKVVRMNGKRYLTWGHHELAFSVRTSRVMCPIFDSSGERLDYIETTKRAGMIPLGGQETYLLRRYFTNSGYPLHTLYRIPTEGELEAVARFTVSTVVEDVLNLSIPEGVKRYLLRDLFGIED